MNKEILRELIKGKEITLQDAKLMGDVSSVHTDYPIKYVVRGDNPTGRSVPIFPVCFSGESLIAKTRGHRGNFAGLEIEKEMQSKAYDDGVPVPYIKGIFNIYNVSARLFIPSLIMERVNGKTLRGVESYVLKVRGSHRKTIVARDLMYRAWELRKRAVISSERKGYIISGDRPNDNAMFDARQKLYLIDTEYWKFVGAQPAESIKAFVDKNL